MVKLHFGVAGLLAEWLSGKVAVDIHIKANLATVTVKFEA